MSEHPVQDPSVRAALLKAQQGVITPRLAQVFDRTSDGALIRMTLIARSNTSSREVRDGFGHPLARIEDRAPFIYDARLPKSELPCLAAEAYRYRRIDLAGIVFGIAVPTPAAVCRVLLALEAPLSSLERTELQNEGVLIGREAFGQVQGEVVGERLAKLALMPWIGSIEVKRVVMPGSRM